MTKRAADTGLSVGPTAWRGIVSGLVLAAALALGASSPAPVGIEADAFAATLSGSGELGSVTS